MRSAEEIFKNFFGGRDPFAGFFDDDDDPFGDFGQMGFGGRMGGMHGMGGMGGMGQMQGMGGGRKRRDPFGFDDDDFFGGGFPSQSVYVRRGRTSAHFQRHYHTHHNEHHTVREVISHCNLMLQ